MHHAHCSFIPPFVYEHIITATSAIEPHARTAFLTDDEAEATALRDNVLRTVEESNRLRARRTRTAVSDRRQAAPYRIPEDSFDPEALDRAFRGQLGGGGAVGAGGVAASREGYDCQTQFATQVDLVRSDSKAPPGSNPTGDADVDDLWDFAGEVRTALTALGRNSVDNNGMDLILNVHYGQAFNNAFWDGSQIVFGDGDNAIFSRFARSRDVVAHELGHAVTQFYVAGGLGLDYYSQSGALNESFSDCWGSVITQWRENDPNLNDLDWARTADWLIGDEIMGPTLQGEALRSMKAPGCAYDNPLLGKDPQPAHMRDYYTGPADNQGVHINSGIPNRAFYLVATEIGSYKAGLLWFQMMPLLPSAQATFADFAGVLVNEARNLTNAGVLPNGTPQSVRLALKDVGIL